METSADRLDAHRFFYSKSPTRVFYRNVWFGLAGWPVPERKNMESMIRGLIRASLEVRTSYEKDL